MPYAAASSHQRDWTGEIPAEAAEVYECVLGRMRREHIPFALGGGLALGVYTCDVRDPKDLDLYILPEDRETAVSILCRCGLEDYYPVKQYVRDWIYRGHQNGIIVDAIWAMANKRAEVDMRWLDAGPTIEMFGQEVRVIPPEELIWSKLYVLQKDRCDWPDIINLIQVCGPSLDWDHLLARVGADRPLVKGILSVFSWVSPARAASIPRRVWASFGLPSPATADAEASRREDLLDTRPWLLADSQCRVA